jgi:hypothetical protein
VIGVLNVPSRGFTLAAFCGTSLTEGLVRRFGRRLEFRLASPSLSLSLSANTPYRSNGAVGAVEFVAEAH